MVGSPRRRGQPGGSEALSDDKVVLHLADTPNAGGDLLRFRPIRRRIDKPPQLPKIVKSLDVDLGRFQSRVFQNSRLNFCDDRRVVEVFARRFPVDASRMMTSSLTI